MTKAGMAELDSGLDLAQREGKLLTCAASDKSMRQRMDRLVEKGALVRPITSSYARTEYWKSLNPTERHLSIVRTLSERHPEWVFCGVSAAAVLGFDPSWELLRNIHTAVERGVHRDISGMVVSHEIRGLETIECDGVLVTEPSRTLFDCLRTVPFADGLAIADRATRINGWQDGHAASIVEQYLGEGRYHGARRARKVAEMVDGRAESGGESIARANMMRLGFAQPELQVTVENVLEPQHPFRVDFGWLVPSKGLIVGEFDGRRKYTDPSMVSGGDIELALLRERQRESRLSAAGARVIRFNYAQARNCEVFGKILERFGVPRGGTWDFGGLARSGYVRAGNVEYCSYGNVGTFACKYVTPKKNARRCKRTVDA